MGLQKWNMKERAPTKKGKSVLRYVCTYGSFSPREMKRFYIMDIPHSFMRRVNADILCCVVYLRHSRGYATYAVEDTLTYSGKFFPWER